MMRRLLSITSMLVLVLPVMASCGSDSPTSEPEGAYLAFRDALLSGHPEELWEWIDETTKQLYRDAVSDLKALAESVDALSPADRSLAYERTPVRLAGIVDSGDELFREIVRLENLAGDDRYRIGTEIDEIDVDDEAHTATVLTEAQQTVELVREDDGIWRVSSLHDEAQSQLAPIAEYVTTVDILAAESAYMRRTHQEIVLLLGGTIEPEPTEGSGEGTGATDP